MTTTVEADRTNSGTPAATGEVTRPVRHQRWVAPVRMVVFDLAGPLIAYRALREHSVSTVSALLVAAAFPLVGVLLTAAKDHRLDAIGGTVLVGTGSGAILSLVVNSPRPTLIFTGVLPALAFGAACLLSVRRSPLIYQILLSYHGGPESERGAAYASDWAAYAGFRRYFRRITLVWGVGYVLESVVKSTIILTAGTGRALAAVGALSIAVPVTLAVVTVISAQIAQRP